MRTYGASYDARLDGARLRTQHDVIRNIMISAGECGAWLTLREIAYLTHYGEASISAQLRHLRKPVFGGYVLEKRRRESPEKGIWEYRVRRPDPPLQRELRLEA